MSDNSFYDTNVLVYFFDTADRRKHDIATALLGKVFGGEAEGTISNQTLAEMFNVLTTKSVHRGEVDFVAKIVGDFVSSTRWRIINYTSDTVKSAAFACRANGTEFWDTLVAETMKENGLDTIYTENTKDFERMQGIKTVNPFK